MIEVDSAPTYPGHHAEVPEILELAGTYQDAANLLIESRPRKSILELAPARFCAIHAIELFLNAFLRHQGAKPEEIRSRMHNLADDGFVETLRIRKKTAVHLRDITGKREYLISRYAPEQADQHTELNRLTATLVEVSSKVRKHLG